MVKISHFSLALLVVGSASAFTPSNIVAPRTFVQSSTLRRLSEALSDEPVAAKTEPAFPSPAAPKKETPKEPAGQLVAINTETVEFTAGALGAVAGFAIGGPVLGAIAAAIANYASKQESEIGEVVQAVSKSSLEVFNYLSNLDQKYEVLDNAKKTLQTSLDKVKASENANPETINKIENALESTTSKIKEINDEYDLVGAGMTALGVVGDLVERAVKKAGELNEEYKLSDRATDSLKTAVNQAKEATNK